MPSTRIDRTEGLEVVDEWAGVPAQRTNPWVRLFSVWGRLVVTLVAFAAQMVLFFSLLTWASASASWVLAACIALSLAVLLHILNTAMPSDYKLAWTIPIILLPIFGGAFYLVHGSRTSKRQIERLREIEAHTLLAEVEMRDVVPPAELDRLGSPYVKQQVNYLAEAGPFLPYRNTATTFYPTGEAAFPAMLEAMERAQDYILAEYFIVSEGRMWDAMFDVLQRKAAEGVQVRFLYDDLGSAWKLPGGFLRKMSAAGIMVKPFNRFGIGVSLRINNRDHRKILVVDGKVGFTGGINIGDEYINEITRFGYWKDTALRLEGPGVWGLTCLFFTMWEIVSGERTDFIPLRPDYSHYSGDGIVVAFDDSPFDSVSFGWGAYRNMMFRAERSVDIMTPYLVPGQEQLEIIGSVARAGVRVRVITPAIPDKRYVNEVTKSNYLPLLRDGVEIYEYTPGFMHAKQMIVDDDYALLGTINFDFRSFYLHQENAVWMYDTPAIADMKADFEKSVAESRRVLLWECQQVPWWRRLLRSALRTFAPMM